MSENTRTQILKAALELFAARGFDGVGVQEIVDAAGVTKPSLYHYFGSKRGLLDAVIAAHAEALLRALKPAAAYHHDLPKSLHDVTAVCFGFAHQHPTFTRMMLSMQLAPPDSEAFQAVSAVNKAQAALVENMFLAAAQDHGNMQGRQRAYTATLLGMINTYITLSFNGDVVLDEELIYQAVHQFSHGIYS